MKAVIISVLAGYIAGVVGSEPLIGPELNLSTSAVDNTKRKHQHKTKTPPSTESTINITLADHSTTIKPATITVTFSYAPISTACTTSIIQTAIVPATAPPSPTTVLETTTIVRAGTTKTQIQPASESASLDLCYSANQPVLNGQAPASCGAAFQQISNCYDNVTPWTDPYNSEQSSIFRTCVCEERPFTENSTFYLLWAGCLHCILMVGYEYTAVMAKDVSLVENFCDTLDPDAYLFLSQFLTFFSQVNAGATTPVTYPVLPLVTGGVQQMASKYTTTPPLANVAYGTNAPSDGTLQGVTPILTTMTSGGDTITSLVRWQPTSGGSYDPVAASLSAKSAALSVLRESYTAEISAQTADPTACYGRGPCANFGQRRRRLDIGLALGGIGLAIGVVMLVL